MQYPDLLNFAFGNAGFVLDDLLLLLLGGGGGGGGMISIFVPLHMLMYDLISIYINLIYVINLMYLCCRQ